MLAFLLKRQNLIYNETLSKNTQVANKLENLELEIKKKIDKVATFNPEECFEYSENSEDSLRSLSHSTHYNKELGKSVVSISTNFRKTHLIEKVSTYKKLSSLAEIIASMIIMIGSIVSFMENNAYYSDNFNNRVFATVLINEIRHYQLNLTEATIEDILRPLNLAKILQQHPARIDTTSPYYSKNNSEIIKMFNLTYDFNYFDGNTTDADIKVPLSISTYCNSLRYILLITSLLACGLSIISRYLEYLKEYIYKKENDKPFVKTEYFLYAVVESLSYLFFQYPNINSFIIQYELGNTFILPYSSILAAVCIFRLCFSFKIFKNLTKWSSLQAESMCEKYVCEANSSFAFKCLQKEYPFITLTLIFLLTCICFGFSLRVFELHYWESEEIKAQDWTYEWNAVWCIFVSMTTVGYGDFFPKTHMGRIIVILACVVGTYFVSMMMVFMTQKSILDETEFKAYKLITRLKLRKEIKSLQAKLIYECIKMKICKNNKSIELEKNEKYHLHRRKVLILIEKAKSKYRRIKTFEFIPTKEQLFDVSERIDNDVNEIMNEIESLKYINDEMISYTDNQIEAVKYLKKNIYATKLIYKMINKNKVFGKLNNLNMDILYNDEEDKSITEKENQSSSGGTRKSDSEDEESKLNMTKVNLNQEEIKSHFEFLINNPHTSNKQKRYKTSTSNKKSTNFLLSPLKKLKKNKIRNQSSKTKVE